MFQGGPGKSCSNNVWRVLGKMPSQPLDLDQGGQVEGRQRAGQDRPSPESGLRLWVATKHPWRFIMNRPSFAKPSPPAAENLAPCLGPFVVFNQAGERSNKHPVLSSTLFYAGICRRIILVSSCPLLALSKEQSWGAAGVSSFILWSLC